MKLKLYFTKSQYLKYEMNISSYYSTTLMHNSYFLLGNYYKNTFINLNYSIYKLKYSLNIIDKFCKVNCANYLIINIIEHISIIKFYKKTLNKFILSYSLGRWKNGLLNNFVIRLPFLHDYINVKMIKIKLPNFVFLIDYKEFKDGKDKISPINLELFRISANSMIFSQASTDSNKTKNIVLQNVKNVSSNLFLMNFVNSILKKYFFLKKLFFFKNIFVGRSNQIYYSKSKKFVFNYYYIKYNLLNFRKLKIWKNGLV